MPKRRPPSRLRYETAHPTVTARVPVEVKARLDAGLQAEGLNFSEWVQAQVAGHAGKLADAHARGFAEGHAAGVKGGDAAGYARGLADERPIAANAGLVAGVLLVAFRGASQDGKALGDEETLGRHLLDRPDQRAVAEELMQQYGHGEALAKLLRTVKRQKP